MHYKVLGRVVCTENSAKPRKQSCQYLRDWIRHHPKVNYALDVGCGRLRYAPELAARSKVLTLVDSEEQLSRTQRIDGDLTTVRDYARSKWNNSRVLSTGEFQHDREKYDLVLCANVLPVIPSRATRTALLRRLHTALSHDGTCLFVCQYRNSYFKDMQNFDGAVKYLDGWAVLRGDNKSTYYGLLCGEKLVRMLERNEFEVVRSWAVGQSAYVLCRAWQRRFSSLHARPRS